MGRVGPVVARPTADREVRGSNPTMAWGTRNESPRINLTKC